MIALLNEIIYKKRIKRIKSSLKNCGSCLKIFGHPSFIHPENIALGDNVNINDGSILNATESHIIIGNNVTVSSNAMILAASYDVQRFLQGGEGSKKHKNSLIDIGDNVWICAGAIILPDVTIADHVIIGAGSVVTRSVEKSWCVIAGNPAKVVKELSPEN